MREHHLKIGEPVCSMGIRMYMDRGFWPSRRACGRESRLHAYLLLRCCAIICSLVVRTRGKAKPRCKGHPSFRAAHALDLMICGAVVKKQPATELSGLYNHLMERRTYINKRVHTIQEQYCSSLKWCVNKHEPPSFKIMAQSTKHPAMVVVKALCSSSPTPDKA